MSFIIKYKCYYNYINGILYDINKLIYTAHIIKEKLYE